MTRKLHLIAIAGLVVALTGCVSQEKYNALKLDRDALAEQLGKSQNDAAVARTEADSLKAQLTAINSNGGNMSALVANLQQQNSNLQAAYDELNRKYGESMSRTGGTALPAPLTNALTEFASANADLVDFDSARGIVKFKSDVTFAVGDATLQPKAKDVISRFATILNSPAASGYELMVAGHTDNQPVVNPATKAKGHINNWYLSAHRAISVADALISHGTNAQRLGVVGYADQHPIASNGSESGKAQNRRVEVLILPTTVRTNVVSTPSAPARSAARQNLNKDTGGSANMPTGPALNK